MVILLFVTTFIIALATALVVVRIFNDSIETTLKRVVTVELTPAWAKRVAMVLAALAAASVFFANYYQIIFPVLAIIGGGYLLFTARRPRAT